MDQSNFAMPEGTQRKKNPRHSIRIRPPELKQEVLDLFDARCRALTEAGFWQDDTFGTGLPLEDIISNFSDIFNSNVEITTRGRIIKLHKFGPLTFAVLQDGINTLELKIEASVLEDQYEIWRQFIRLGDLIIVRGTASHSKRSAPQLRVCSFRMASACALDWENIHSEHPSGFYQGRQSRGLHTHMIGDLDAISRFRIRSAVLRALREWLSEHQFEEQLTPLLSRSFYGGLSHPYTTYSRSRRREEYLRVTSEIALKMMMVGGLSRLYEIGPSFRNESEDRIHVSPFTILEAYAAFTRFDEMLLICEKMILFVFSQIRQYLINTNGKSVSFEHFNQEIEKVSAREVLRSALNIDFESEEGVLQLAKICNRAMPQSISETAFLVHLALERFVYPMTIKPTFIVGLPSGNSPFIAEDTVDKLVLQRAFLIIKGRQIAEVFASQQNPLLQLEGIESQIEGWLALDGKVRRDYRNFVHAIFCGAPPIGVMDVGIERLFMVLTNESDVRNTILSL